jgi:hypothetical protein
VPLGVILPACDSDVINQEGHLYYEITRLDPPQGSWSASVWLERANHNYFNNTLSDEAVARRAGLTASLCCNQKNSAPFSTSMQLIS